MRIIHLFFQTFTHFLILVLTRKKLQDFFWFFQECVQATISNNFFTHFLSFKVVRDKFWVLSFEFFSAALPNIFWETSETWVSIALSTFWHIIKARQRNFVDFINSCSMICTLNFIHWMPWNIFYSTNYLDTYCDVF